MTGRILRQDGDGLCTLVLNRPEKHNALDNAAFEELNHHLTILAKDDGKVDCVVLRGAGKGFCAGADLAAIGSTAAPLPPTYKPMVVEALSRLPMPTIAAVHGVCFTGGLELALGCDFIVAEAGARFADTHGKWGLVAAWGLYPRLARRIGVANAKRMSITACEIDAEEALRVGLADLMAPAGQLDNSVEDFVAQIRKNSGFSNRAVKQIYREIESMPLDQALAHTHYRHPGIAPDFAARVATFTKG